jgi:putative RecB family exonuclease
LACSLKFYFERVACIRKPTPAALHLGKAVHAALQAFHLARWRGGDNSPEAIANAYELAFLRLERDEGPVNFDDEAEREKCRQDALRVVAAYLDSPEAMKEKPRAVEVMLKEDIAGLSVPLTGAMDLVEGNFTPVDFKSEGSTRALAAWKARITTQADLVIRRMISARALKFTREGACATPRPSG